MILIMIFLRELKVEIHKSNKQSFADLKLSPINLAEMINMISKKVISGKIAKEILPELIKDNISPQKVVEEKGLAMISDSESIVPIIEELIIEYPKEVKSFKEGKTKLLGFFVGQLMKKTKGKATLAKEKNRLLSVAPRQSVIFYEDIFNLLLEVSHI